VFTTTDRPLTEAALACTPRFWHRLPPASDDRAPRQGGWRDYRDFAAAGRPKCSV